MKTNKEWHKKIHPGISSFEESPNKVGKKHLKKLIEYASEIIPKSQIHRTPIFLHATAGMRLLRPDKQEKILNEACEYIREKSRFYLPDCKSHVNTIDGDLEGIYGWISLNYLLGALDEPSFHQHGKDHNTYGLLDMGGASTQVVFQPNSTESKEHDDDLYLIKLITSGEKELSWKTFSTTFLGYGMNEARTKYVKTLKNGDDPCLNSGQTIKSGDQELKGTGNYTQCVETIQPLIAEEANSENCQLNSKEPASCLLSSSMPSFDFDVDRFVGVSGYWDITNGFSTPSDSNDDYEAAYNAYDYASFEKQIKTFCETSWDDLKKKENVLKFKNIKKDDLKEACFRANWVTSILHKGLGFPIYGLHEGNNTTITSLNDNDTFSDPFQAIESINGSDFSWTLGRAVLYASSEISNSAKDTVSITKGATNYIGGEIQDYKRPIFTEDYSKIDDEHEREHWKDYQETHKHRLYGSIVFLIIISIITYLMLGKTKRSQIWETLKNPRFRYNNVNLNNGTTRRQSGMFSNLIGYLSGGRNPQRYQHVDENDELNDLENGMELRTMRGVDADQFSISSDEESEVIRV